jgi:hypothetical protein
MKLSVLSEGWVDWFQADKPPVPAAPPSLQLTVDDLPRYVDRFMRDYIRYHKQVEDYPELLRMFDRVSKAIKQNPEVVKLSWPELRVFMNRMLDRLLKDHESKVARGLVKKK